MENYSDEIMQWIHRTTIKMMFCDYWARDRMAGMDAVIDRS
jgi:hypothetical protein